MIYQVTITESHEIYKKKKTREKTARTCEYVTVPKQFKINEFQSGMFLKPCNSSLLEVIIFNIQLSIIRKLNHNIQEQWH